MIRADLLAAVDRAFLKSVKIVAGPKTMEKPMTKADLLALADRVEREEPCDDLNWHIGQTQPVTPGKPRWLDYTTSLDAAASLVPEGWWVKEISYDGCPDAPYVCTLAHSELPAEVWANGDDEPRARTAAALRAMAMEMGDE